MTTRVAVLGVSVGSMVALGGSAGAQVAADSPCAAAVTAAATPPVTARASAVRVLRNCPAEGPRVLAAMWHQPIPEPALGLALSHSSARLLDQRVYEAVSNVAGDPARPVRERAYAMAAMVMYVTPGVLVEMKRLDEPTLYGIDYFDVSVVDHDSPTPGAVPIAVDLPGDVEAHLGRLSQSDSNAQVRTIAKYLASAVRAARTPRP